MAIILTIFLFKLPTVINKYTETWGAKGKAFSIDDVIYKTVRGAARVLNINRQTIIYRLSAGNFPNYYIISNHLRVILNISASFGYHS